MSLANTLVENVRKRRQRAGLSQEELAHRAGLSTSIVSRLEQGKKKDVRLATVEALARGLGVHPLRLLGGRPG